MTETPVILSHNVLRNGLVTGTSRDGYPAWRIADGLRWTWWEGLSAGTHYLYITLENMLRNGDFEMNADGWFIGVSGGGSGSFERNTTSPIDGEADLRIGATTANSETAALRVTSLKSYYLVKGRTYRFSFAAAADSSRQFRFGFLNSTGGEETFGDATLSAATSEMYVDFTPSSNGKYHVFWRPLEAGNFYVDDAHLCEIRDVDTFLIDRGHSLNGYAIQVHKTETAYSNAAYSSWMSAHLVLTDRLYYANTEVGSKGVKYRVTVTPLTMATLPTPRITQMWIGRQWRLPRNFSGRWDNHASRNYSIVTRGERGIESRTNRARLRILDGVLKSISPAEYADLEKFMADTEDGALPFVFIGRPETEPDDALVMRLDKEERFAPYDGGYFREWPFRAVEVPGFRDY